MPREILVDGVTINDDSDCYVIAEIGHNHQGSLEQCKQMFQAAKECGASAVKLQKRNNRELYTKEMYDSPYDNRNSYGKTYGEHREAVEFEREEYGELLKYAGEIGITIFSTAFDVPSADFLAKLDMPAYKVASGDLTNIPLIICTLHIRHGAAACAHEHRFTDLRDVFDQGNISQIARGDFVGGHV